jgi:DNA-binding PucR family transcriptional regulator
LSEVSLAALTYSYQNMQGFNYLSDVVLDQLLINFTDIKQRIINEFNQVPHELVLTAQAYLKSGLNAKAASEMLYIHRNTFNYRLNKFIEITELDIRDYWHAFYFNIYVKLLSK